jgi:type IV pilus assembly protein PilY1
MKTIRKLIRSIVMVMALGALGYSASLRAEDIDIYFENSSEGLLPKVLFVLDNSANVASTWGPAGCPAYGDGGAPSLGTTTAGGIVQCALVDAINSLPDGRLEVGIMSGNANNFGTSRGCMGSSGGCLLLPFTEIKASTRADVVAFIKSWVKENSGNGGEFPFTVTSAEAGGMMQETYAYFYAQTGLSGRTYTTNHIQACQKNFIIYIGNTDKTPANEDPSGAALVAAGAGSISYGTSGTLRDKITTTQVFQPGICPSKIESLAAGTNQNDWSNNWADEWARFLQYKDGGTETQLGKQNVTTYTIGIIDNASNQCTAPYAALLQSMATVTGGEAYRVGDAGAVKEAIAKALNEVQAVNSVFSSASLPVSVNAEGSYLNQIFLGMFRPDSTGNPRWLGNLKQYQLIRDNAGNLVMGDSASQAAINSKTGFLSPNAISFWTYKDTSALPDADGGTALGFFARDPKGAAESAAFDRADGEVVEKGGVAQQLRKQSLTATFVGDGGTSVNPRRVYTYCAWDATGCRDRTATLKDLTHRDNDFSTSNSNIAATTFGSALTVPVASIVREGTTATITTSGNHGFTAGSVVTIKNVDQVQYNQTAAIGLVSGSSNKFTMTVPDYPTAVSEGAYTISVPGAAGSKAITSLTRMTTAGGGAEETVTVTTGEAHLYVSGQTVTLSGMSATEYNRGWQITSTPATNQFTFKAPIYPVSQSLNTYSIVHSPTNVAINSITVSGSTATVAASSAHGFHVGQTVTISNVKGADKDLYNVSHLVTGVSADGKSFTIATPGNAKSAGTGNVSPSTTAQTAKITRNTTAVSGATATVSGMPDYWFANNDKVNITTTGTSPNEAAYVKSDVTITCSGTCNSFTYPIDVTPAVSATGGSVSIPDAGASVDIAAGAIRRTGTTATVTMPSGSFSNGSAVTISPNGTSRETEAAYVGSWTITCVGTSPCSQFTIGPVTLTPALIATGRNMQAYSNNTPPDKDLLIRWLRGEDNYGDEKGPQHGVTVRPSVHGDVLHSRPLVINYGDSRGIAVFYGSNDGVYRAVNGNQSASTSNSGLTVPAGGEFWGLILPDHYEVINRYRTNSPEVKFPGTFLSTALPKQYFVDGPTGVYQKIDANGVIQQAIIYLTMRRGGRFMYALDVTQPAAPKYLWQIRFQDEGFSELGQTWSRPRLTLLQNYKKADATGTLVPWPVLVFGAGYDDAQDWQPDSGTTKTADTMGRGIFVVDAISGTKVFSASVSCPDATANCRKVANMKYATPSDIAFVDRDVNGFTDKFYWGDLGGNLWRADVADADVSNWSITQVAALGCNTGECSLMTTPRKFFFPPAVLSVRPAGAENSYEMLSIVSGDREHPLRSLDTNSAYLTNDRFFMVKDLGTTVNSTALNTTGVVPNSMFDATYTSWNQSDPGFYINFIGDAWTNDRPDSTKTPTLGEKAVNAPTAVNGQIFFSTNQPKTADGTCTANLGRARAYAVSPFDGTAVHNELEGGGLPPSAVSGLITITETDGSGNTTTTQEKFCIGCGVSGSQVGGTNSTPCTSALENCNIGTVIPKNLKRTYWYKK